MKNFLLLLFLSFPNLFIAQNQQVGTVYFDFDKHTLKKNQIEELMSFIQKVDTATLDSVQIYGYCDDRGTNDYNYKLSNRRVKTIQDLLLEKGFNNQKIVILEGKGRVLVEDSVSNLDEIRSKNRRVDVLFVQKNSFGNKIFSSLQKEHQVGDRIYFERILFENGSSKLTPNSKRELDKIAKELRKRTGIYFEIRGHVCCTSAKYKDAIDSETDKRNLSLNRAETVFNYLKSQGIDSNRMTYKGLGNQFPLGKGDAYDRRVEFLILKI